MNVNSRISSRLTMGFLRIARSVVIRFVIKPIKDFWGFETWDFEGDGKFVRSEPFRAFESPVE